MTSEEFIIKRSGESQRFNPSKVLDRFKMLCGIDNKEYSKLNNVNYDKLTRSIINQIYNGIKSSDLDILAAKHAENLSLENIEYSTLATRFVVSNHHKNLSTNPGLSLLNIMEALWNNVDDLGRHSPLIAPHIIAWVRKFNITLEEMIDYNLDYNFTYTGFMKLMNKYLLRASLLDSEGNPQVYMQEKTEKIQRWIVETPQIMWMRVALGIWVPAPVDYKEDHYRHRENFPKTSAPFDEFREFWENEMEIWSQRFANVIDEQEIKTNIRSTYEYLSSMKITHATPTLFNAGMITPQLSSCFLTTPSDDSLEAIYDFQKNTAMISKWAGGIGSHVHKIRPRDAYIAGSGGKSNGLIPMLEVSSKTAVYVDQSSKRAGSHAVYLELWHGDIADFINIRHPRYGTANNLFPVMWICDEFMRTLEREEALIKAGETDVRLWYLMDLNICPGLADAFDQVLSVNWIDDSKLMKHKEDYEFTYLYRSYIKAGQYIKRVSARELWISICENRQEIGVPYLLFKDSINRKSNQANLGTIQSSNLCSEIVEFSNFEETAVCNLASVCVNKFICLKKPIDAEYYPFSDGWSTPEGQKWIDWTKFANTIERITKNLNRVIDVNYYSIPSTRLSNMRHRPMGIGVQGLADLFSELNLEFGTMPACELDYRIAELMYFIALETSVQLAKKQGVYSSWENSPAERGFLQFDLWEYEHKKTNSGNKNPLRWNLWYKWNDLKKQIKKYGLRNSLFLAFMPTASTSTIMGNSPAFEPHNAMVYKRTDESGEALMVNTLLQKRLSAINLWNREIREKILDSRTGGIGEILEIPREIRKAFITAYELKPRLIVNHALARSPFIDQSQSMNLFEVAPTQETITKITYYSWRRGIKTACYYLRRLPSTDARKVHKSNEPKHVEDKVCIPGCDSCGA